MTNQLQPQQDFFLYIPEICDEQTPAYSTADRPIDSAPNVPTDNVNWIKIPLVGKLVVYACVWDEQEQLDQRN